MPTFVSEGLSLTELVTSHNLNNPPKLLPNHKEPT
jgi:hypothetical protein